MSASAGTPPSPKNALARLARQSSPRLTSRHPNHNLRFPFGLVRLLIWVGAVRLQTRAEPVAVLRGPGIPLQPLLRSPIQQRRIRLQQAVAVVRSGVDERRIATRWED